MPGLLPAHIKSLILDMDGVLWKADAPIGDLPAIFARLRERGLKVAFATNNGTRTPDQYVDRLAGFGVKVEPRQVVTSALVLAELLMRRLALTPGSSPDVWERGEGVRAKVFAIGGEGVMTALREKGFTLLSVEEAEKAKAVVVGIDRQINFQKMVEAALLVRRGVPFYATNPDKTFPTPRGEIPGAGAWISVIVTATGIEPIYAGKPAPYLLELARERLGTAKEETLVVGDRLETDIAGGQVAGYPVAVVLSGVSTRQQAEAWRPVVDVIAEDLYTLVM
ncbi:MAG: HAD-IIA family hydrolase [Chloroflexi bacterium]|nr:HAD-IIA family hydrolase [Chloroflexota bacterium]